MNHRVLELLKAPKNIQSEDIDLLKEEINSFPYVQNIRALYLYGVHLYDKENYQKVLSTTAAYTTDKKILYQLINGKIQQQPKPEIKPEIVKEKPIPAENPLSLLKKTKISGFPIKREENPVVEVQPEVFEEPKDEIADKKEEAYILPPPKQEIKHISVNGERNRILFEGEENFLEDDNVEKIDLESTLESGSIVTQKADKKEEAITKESVEEEANSTESKNQEDDEETTEYTPETIIEENKIASEKEEILDESEVSFHETESFDPKVQNSEIEVEEKTDEYETAIDRSESSDLDKIEEVAEFTPETIIEEETMTSETEKGEILNESEVSFQKIESFNSEIEDAANENTTESENLTETEETAEFTPEKIINEDHISSEKEEKTIQDESELSFHGMESFLPEVKIQVNNSAEATTEMSQSNINKHEEEMRRLIEEVEKKMKEKAASERNIEEEPENTGHDISFAETQSFEVASAEPESKEDIKHKVSTEETEPVDDIKEEPELVSQESTDIKSVWKPMSFESNLPDSLLKSAEISRPKIEIKAQESEVSKPEIQNEKSQEQEILNEITGTPEFVEDKHEQTNEEAQKPVTENKEDVAVMNVSFFGSGWTIAEPKKGENEEDQKDMQENAEETVSEKIKPETNILDSNIPGFINTWQSWLKIDRTEHVEKEKIEIKVKAIENFIENNPKISQLRDEGSYVVKERNHDISHLMTETLANLYFEQKLYTKAIKAFEILINKNPEKKEYFEGRIQEIKDFRTKG
ncbi:hypothetical protein QFZ37_000435 [Chryseobacterium ginsenosidimutans]|uniref:hypothetical protein n=1 Tax=Chryseobacterium ginsenosidimutans TaxID=687846 RepID=UPI0027854216|nr:hypothetical protein [Chryseobacterium ginsenosidimutans]MDQ0592066.1 hypothetical protein [Chryseobacterium ginsenosidimutans]